MHRQCVLYLSGGGGCTNLHLALQSVTSLWWNHLLSLLVQVAVSWVAPPHTHSPCLTELLWKGKAGWLTFILDQCMYFIYSSSCEEQISEDEDTTEDESEYSDDYEAVNKKVGEVWYNINPVCSRVNLIKLRT